MLGLKSANNCKKKFYLGKSRLSQIILINFRVLESKFYGGSSGLRYRNFFFDILEAT